MSSLIGRSEWGARSPRARNTVGWDSRTEFVVHHSAGPPSQSVRAIQDFHMDGRGWSDIGYNLLVDDDGNAYEGRGWLVVGAHAVGHNTSGVGVCYIGYNDASDAAKAAIRGLYDKACRKAGRRLAAKGHRDVNDTSCPGGGLHAWVHDGMPTKGLSRGGDDVIGLVKGDKGEDVEALQALIIYAGQDLPRYGVDRHYGDETAEGLRKVRASVGSRALDGYGDKVTGYAYAQLMKAVAHHQD